MENDEIENSGSENPINGLEYSDTLFWLSHDVDKSKVAGLVALLERRAGTQQSMCFFRLPNCDLRGINLVNGGYPAGFDLRNAELDHSCLRSAHLYAINLHGASLLKADFSDANLHCADLTDANLLGIRLDGARIDNVKWGDRILQEKLGDSAAKEGRQAAALDYYEQAEEIYRNLRLHLERAGLFDQAGDFFYREKVMHRKRLPFFSYKRLLSRVIDLLCGYGEKPLRVIVSSLNLLMMFALLYFLAGVNHGSGIIGFSPQKDLWQNIVEFMATVYFSVVTFTTLGYGDITPSGIVRVAAAVEAFIGSFFMALFVFVFIKRMSR